MIVARITLPKTGSVVSVRIGAAGEAALREIIATPGIHAAEVDRRARTARGGHRWMYATIARLVSNGLVTYCPSVFGRGVGLCPTEAGRVVLAGR